MTLFWTLVLILSNAVVVTFSLRVCRSGGGASPGCDFRPSCYGTNDEHCKPARYFKDACFTGVYWECAIGEPVPAVCPYGLVVNQEGIDRPNDTSVSLCDWPGSVHPSQDAPSCGCDPGCNSPPECPTVIPKECKGSAYLPFEYDCQFYWTCSENHVPHLSACGAGLYFQPRGLFSGNCVPPPEGTPSTHQVPAEAIACCLNLK